MTVTIDMAYLVCKKCGICFGVPKHYWNLHDSHDVLCPNGHRQSTGEDATRVTAQANESWHRLLNEAGAAERTISALRGQITRLKKRLAAKGDH